MNTVEHMEGEKMVRLRDLLDIVMAGAMLGSGICIFFTHHGDPVMTGIGMVQVGIAYLICVCTREH